jgi:hypothetical protein
LKDILRRIASLVVEVPEDTPPPSSSSSSYEPSPDPAPSGPPRRKTIAELVREAEGPNLEDVHVPMPPQSEPVRIQPSESPAEASAPTVPSAPAGPLFGADGQVDVNAVYAKANLPTSPFTAEQAFEMLQGLPAEMPVETKRQMARVMLSAMGKTLGVTPESIVMDAARKVAALHSFFEGMSKQSETFVAQREEEIRGLEAKIVENRNTIELARQRIATLDSSCTAEGNRLNQAAEFFSTGSPTPTGGNQAS